MSTTSKSCQLETAVEVSNTSPPNTSKWANVMFGRTGIAISIKLTDMRSWWVNVYVEVLLPPFRPNMISKLKKSKRLVQ